MIVVQFTNVEENEIWKQKTTDVCGPVLLVSIDGNIRHEDDDHEDDRPTEEKATQDVTTANWTLCRRRL